MSIFPTKILLATDGSEDAHLAARSAVNLAEGTGSELHVVYVAEHTVSTYYTEILEEAKREARELLDREVKQIEDYGGEVEEAHVRFSHPDEKIVTLAQEIGAGLIAIGSRGLSPVRRLLVGSVSGFVVRHAHCPVMVVRWKPMAFPANILLASDGSEEATLALQSAADLAQRTGSDLHLMTVAPDYPYVYDTYYNLRRAEEIERVRQEAQRVLDEQVRKAGEAGASVAKSHLRVGAVDEEVVVLGEEEGVDLIVVGSRGLGGVRRALMGSVSDSVVRHAHCPVLVMRPEK